MKSYGIINLFIGLMVIGARCSGDKAEPQVKIDVTVWPTTGTVDRLVTIESNHGFSSKSGGNIVTFNKMIAKVRSESPNTITVLSPAGAMSGPIAITADGREIEGPVFTYVEPRSADVYYVRGKSDGLSSEYLLHEAPNFSVCSNDCLSAIVGESGTKFTILLHPRSVTPFGVEQLVGSTFSVSTGAPPTAFLSIATFGGHFFSSSATGNGETLTINSVTYNGSLHGTDSYDVSGTFAAKLKDQNGSESRNYTEGTFLVPFAAKP